jgi:hypothetical protein
MKKIVLLITMGLTIFVGCNDEELLDKTPHGPSDKSFYVTVNGATQGLISAYSILQLGQSVERVEFAGTTCSGDALAGGEPGGNDSPDMQSMMKFQAAPNTAYLNIYWNSMYTGIFRCNILLEYLNKKDELQDFPKDDILRKQLMGEAYFMRGLFHFKLQTMFGGYPQLQGTFNNQLKGVPYVDRVFTVSEANIERPPLDSTWAGIARDFKAASELLKNRSEYEADYLGRATKGAALSMLGKTYLYQDKFAEAYPILKEVINSGEYFLYGENGEKYTINRTSKEGNVDVQVSGFKYRAQPEANNLEEAIFDVQHRADHSSDWPEPMQGSLVVRHYGPRRIMIHDSLTANDQTVSFLLNFWSFMIPTTYYLKTAFPNVGCDPAERDPRYKLSVYGPDDSIPYYYPDPAFRAMWPDSVKNDAYCNWPTTGYLTWTYFCDPKFDIVRTTLGDMPFNTRYLHFNDLLLMGAEAAVETGNNADALTWINRVRTRARNAGVTGFPQDYTGTLTVDQVYAERRVELAFEGQEFYTIVRTGRAEKILKQDAMVYPTVTHPILGATAPQQFGDNFVVGKNEIFPIPQAQIDLSQGKLTQNPLY